MKKNKIPAASYRRSTHTIMYRGITTYTVNPPIAGAINYVPSKRGLINIRSKSWERVPPHIEEQYINSLSEKMVDSFGMNKNWGGFVKTK